MNSNCICKKITIAVTLFSTTYWPSEGSYIGTSKKCRGCSFKCKYKILRNGTEIRIRLRLNLCSCRLASLMHLYTYLQKCVQLLHDLILFTMMRVSPYFHKVTDKTTLIIKNMQTTLFHQLHYVAFFIFFLPKLR